MGVVHTGQSWGQAYAFHILAGEDKAVRRAHLAGSGMVAGMTLPRKEIAGPLAKREA